MIAIKKTFRKFSEDFSLINRSSTCFLYARNHGGVSYYEVWLKRPSKGLSPFGESKIRKYIMPSNEDFGQYAWCYRSKEKAMEKFNSL